jgi:AraC-like DNA-binding protein
MLVTIANRLPGSIRILCEVAPDFGVPPEQCLQGTGLQMRNLYDPNLKISTAQELTAISNLLAHAPTMSGMGIAVGRRIRPEVLGIWGYAILTSPTVRASLLTAIDFYQLSFPTARVELVEVEGVSLANFDVSKLPASLRQFVLERHLSVLLNFATALLPSFIDNDITLRTTEYDAAFARCLYEQLGVNVVADTRMNAVVMPTSALDHPLPQHTSETLAACLQHTPNLQDDGGQSSWSNRVLHRILPELRAAPTLTQVARGLGTSERTLTRRLADEGTNFRAILLKTRLAVAHALLTNTSLSVSTVAWRAGYRESSSFVRAFSKTYGITPGNLSKHRAT